MKHTRTVLSWITGEELISALTVQVSGRESNSQTSFPVMAEICKSSLKHTSSFYSDSEYESIHVFWKCLVWHWIKSVIVSIASEDPNACFYLKSLTFLQSPVISSSQGTCSEFFRCEFPFPISNRVVLMRPDFTQWQNTSKSVTLF